MFIKVRATEGLVMFTNLSAEGFNDRALEASYKISLSSIDETLGDPKSLFISGNHGNVNATQIQPGVYEVEWENVIPNPQSAYSGKIKISGVEVYSNVYLASDLKALKMASRCDLIPGSEFQFILDNGDGTHSCFLIMY